MFKREHGFENKTNLNGFGRLYTIPPNCNGLEFSTYIKVNKGIVTGKALHW